MKALRILMYSSLCFWPLAHLQSENRKSLIKPVRTSSVWYSLLTGQELLVPHSDKIWFRICISGRNLFLCFCIFFFLKLSYLCLNVYTSRPRLGSSGRTVTYIPILYLMLVLSHLEHIQESCMRSPFVTRCESPDYSNLQTNKYSRGSTKTHISSLTNWWEVFSVCEPQSWSDIW